MELWKKVLLIITTTIVILWVYVIAADYLNFKHNEHMVFCLKQGTKQVSLGTTFVCKGFGYSAYRYEWVNENGDKISAEQFGPFFIQEKTKISDLYQK